jgi:hypothetical protein
VNRNIVPFNLAWTPLPIKLEPIPLNVFWSAKYHRDPANQWLRAMMFDTFSEGTPHEPATGGLFISTSACRIHGFGGGILCTGGHSRHRRWRNPAPSDINAGARALGRPTPQPGRTMDLNLEMEGGVFQRREAADSGLAVQHAGLPAFLDGGTDDYEVRDAHNLVGFVELFYLWCFMHGAQETSMSRFELSATRLIAL